MIQTTVDELQVLIFSTTIIDIFSNTVNDFSYIPGKVAVSEKEPAGKRAIKRNTPFTLPYISIGPFC